MEEANNIVKEKMNGTTIFVMVCGSHAYNLNMAESDKDFLAVYVADTRKFLSLDGIQDTITHENPDLTCHEVGKFCRLLLKGNPGIIETLFPVYKNWISPQWEELEKHRDKFLSQKVVKQYLGYAIGQLSRLEKGKLLLRQGKVCTKCGHDY